MVTVDSDADDEGLGDEGGIGGVSEPVLSGDGPEEVVYDDDELSSESVIDIDAVAQGRGESMCCSSDSSRDSSE